jgi:hypothetical protein
MGVARMKGNRIKSLSHGDPVPTGEPKRYRSSHGYIRLRWKVGERDYVEAYEHRLVAGLDAVEVHHVNHDKADNRPENLQALSRREHGARHVKWNVAEAANLYRGGLSTTAVGAMFGVTPGQVSRQLRRAGVQMRDFAGRPRPASV